MNKSMTCSLVLKRLLMPVCKWAFTHIHGQRLSMWKNAPSNHMERSH